MHALKFDSLAMKIIFNLAPSKMCVGDAFLSILQAVEFAREVCQLQSCP